MVIGNYYILVLFFSIQTTTKKNLLLLQFGHYGMLEINSSMKEFRKVLMMSLPLFAVIGENIGF
ncbi:hypothetical protein Gotri_025980 [Gossypium trilobum]|uniref:Uncharacterized protein n=1 Tax=Gossypium trilobum TaxID=34281 RepID=A0A7J9FGS6_9ROSI|nr:hypothetical protein [Gossypium trilobum]